MSQLPNFEDSKSDAAESFVKFVNLQLETFMTVLSIDQREILLIGFKDGFQSPVDFDSGLTFSDDPSKNELYDLGVSLGQSIGCLNAFFEPA